MNKMFYGIFGEQYTIGQRVIYYSEHNKTWNAGIVEDVLDGGNNSYSSIRIKVKKVDINYNHVIYESGYSFINYPSQLLPVDSFDFLPRGRGDEVERVLGL